MSHCTKIPDSCTQNPDEVPGEVCPGYQYKSDTILFQSIGFGPGFEYKPLDEFRDLSGGSLRIRTKEHGKPLQVLKTHHLCVARTCNSILTGPLKTATLTSCGIHQINFTADADHFGVLIVANVQATHAYVDVERTSAAACVVFADYKVSVVTAGPVIVKRTHSYVDTHL